MEQAILPIIIFIMGAFFGSFFTLAVYRIPLGKDITHEHSFCPNCNHKLGILDLFPILSYLFLRGKCRYCKEPISIRYFLLEISSGLTFLAFYFSLHMTFENLDIYKLSYFLFTILYFCSLFIMAGIDKEKRTIQKSVLIYGIIVEAIYMVYLCVVEHASIYRYIIYLVILLILIVIDTRNLKKKATSSYPLQILMLSMYMVLFTGEYVFILTVIATVISIILYEIEKRILSFIKRYRVEEKKKIKPIPVGFYLCVTNIICVVIINCFMNYVS